MASIAAAAAGGLAAASYINAKYQISRELESQRRLKRAERSYAKAVKEDRLSPWYILADVCKKHPNKRAVWSRAGSCTFQEFHDQTVQYAQWLLEQGVRPGDLVAMYLLNSADFLMIMFATLCIGAGPAFINYNLEGKALMHCLAVCETKILIADSDDGCQKRLNGSRGEIESTGTRIVTLDDPLKQKIKSGPVVVPEDKYRNGMKGDHPYCLIYTSGTTGLPKGCPFLVARTHLLGSHLEPSFGAEPGKDCWYSPMPLYHGTGVITSSIALLGGIGIAVTPRFSVSNFWPDVHDSGSTMFIYVGETARYLLNAPPHPLERKHKIRLAYGNGLRPDVWKRFQDRFNIPEIGEFFNSSEGMFSLVVWDRGPYLQGCVGHHGLLYRMLYRNIYIPVLIDHETGDIWRDPKTGFAKRMPYEEGGEILVAVPNKQAFGGYWRNPSATEKRFATNVFKEGDLYYRCGDALRRSPDGHWYFMDRLGDTFRWKSENVSTAEVAETLGRYPGVSEANVYGVVVPSHEGRAGCAAIHIDPAHSSSLDHRALLKYAKDQLPRYAVPLFLRVVKTSSHIHNHKQNKVPLRKEGVDPNLIGTEEKSGADDIILWLKPGETNTYVPFERQDWDKLVRGEVRL
ncbi:hypothetical protein LTS08_002227 [Lithohypha guttulata]|uniref:Very long-chain fatty acid transport protein n=1 Tax=Lithohypha guttulata TaxID=1690604 RepID=A0AAN7T614_9EURO|nr:hypothetical protein LTR51_004256 [Lithohypha guttulata]KAK5090863.1 hypothetical protein LTR05_001040 [Lithohypha guttulata]KAK5104339.1 hypothetical protein LTS08_002227 [Lithohypha guttulata]